MSEQIRVRLNLGYDGTDFSGWAAQPGRRTVAGELLGALHRLLGSAAATGLTVAGRTDAGVHATGQVCHVDLDAGAWRPIAGTLVSATGEPGLRPQQSRPGGGAVRRLNAVLPPDVRVRAVTEVPASFDARFSATFRRYEYRVTDAEYGAEPLRRHEILAWPRRLDLAALNAAAAGLVGEHDYAAYCRRKEHATTVRELTRLDWRREPDGILVGTVQADAFCQSMVRSLVGAMLVAGDGRRPTDWPGSLLNRRERASEVTVVPPHGLTLVAVGYPDDPAGYARQASATRRLRAPVEAGSEA